MLSLNFLRWIADSTACLKAHNDKRKLHGAQALAWDAGLAQHAKDWAAELVKLGKLQHAANRPGEGENLFWGMKSKGTYDCADAVKAWYVHLCRFISRIWVKISGQGAGVLIILLGWSVPSGPESPYPISDQIYNFPYPTSDLTSPPPSCQGNPRTLIEKR